MKLWLVFMLFWLIDAFVPWLYQTLVFGSSFVPTAILLGLFPALIIAISIRMNYRKIALQEAGKNEMDVAHCDVDGEAGTVELLERIG